MRGCGLEVKFEESWPWRMDGCQQETSDELNFPVQFDSAWQVGQQSL